MSVFSVNYISNFLQKFMLVRTHSFCGLCGGKELKKQTSRKETQGGAGNGREKTRTRAKGKGCIQSPFRHIRSADFAAGKNRESKRAAKKRRAGAGNGREKTKQEAKRRDVFKALPGTFDLRTLRREGIEKTNEPQRNARRGRKRPRKNPNKSEGKGCIQNHNKP